MPNNPNIIAVANKKGGVGKSIITINMALLLAKKGFKTLIIDIDGQGTTTNFITESVNLGVADAILKLKPIEDIILKYQLNLDLAPATPKLNNLQYLMEQHQLKIGKESCLKKAIQPVLNKYDYIIIDTPGVVDQCTINALTAATGVLIPVIPDGTSYGGTETMLQLIEEDKELNPNLKCIGLIFNRVERSSILPTITKQFEDLANSYNTQLLKTSIRKASIVSKGYTEFDDWTSRKLPIKEDYENLCKYLITYNKKEREN